jgi:starch synthase
MEIEPFLRVTDAADFIRRLPQGLQDKGHEIRILMPKFGVINERRNRLHEVVRLSGINIRVGNEEKPLTIKVATIQNTRLQVYFLDNEDYFLRKSVLTDPQNGEAFYEDNDERSIFFCKGVVETVKKLGWTPHIVHCHGWMTALIPLYLKTHFREDPTFVNSKVVYTLYNDLAHQPLPTTFAEKARLEGMPAELLQPYANPSYLGFSRGGTRHADVVTIGQPKLEDPFRSLLETNDGAAEVFPNFIANEKDYVDFYDALYRRINPDMAA